MQIKSRIVFLLSLMEEQKKRNSRIFIKRGKMQSDNYKQKLNSNNDVSKSQSKYLY